MIETQATNSKLKIQNATIWLRPRAVGALLDQAVVLYRRNFAVFVGIVALVQVPVSVVLTLVSTVLLDPESLSRTPPPPRSGADPAAIASSQAATVAALSDLLSRMLLFVALAVIGGILLNIATGALAKAISESYLGRPIGVIAAYRAVWRQVPALTGLILLVGIATVLLIVPPLFAWIFISWSFAAQAIVLEGTGVAGGLQRSWELVRGSWWRVFGAYLLLLLVGVIVSLSSSLVSVLLSLTGASWAVQNIGSQFVALLLSVLYVPIRLAGMTLLYYDLRVRKEGYDLQVALDARAATLGLEPAAPAAVVGGAAPATAAWPYRPVAPASWPAQEVARL